MSTSDYRSFIKLIAFEENIAKNSRLPRKTITSECRRGRRTLNKQRTTSPSSGSDPNQKRNTTGLSKAKDNSDRPVKKRTMRGKVRVYRGCIDVWAPIRWAAAPTGKPPSRMVTWRDKGSRRRRWRWQCKPWHHKGLIIHSRTYSGEKTDPPENYNTRFLSLKNSLLYI